MKQKRAFTLIELLIVVAIIAILAAIAVPNFLEAQVRAKVAHMKNSLRTVQVALESYVVDTNHVPLCTYAAYNPPSGSWPLIEQWKVYPGYPGLGRAGSITTPIAYLTSNAPLMDIFRKAHNFQSPLANEIMYLPSEFYSPYTRYQGLNSMAYYSAQTNRYAAYVIRCAGPDTYYQNMPGVQGDYGFGGTSWNRSSYDPTNGTVSTGDIYRSQKFPEDSSTQ